MAPVLGAGPVYFAAGAYNPEDRSTMKLIPPTDPRSQGAGTGWGIAKTAIVMRKTVRQPLLLRGQRLDGPGTLGFAGDAGHRPFAALQFKAGYHTIGLGESSKPTVLLPGQRSLAATHLQIGRTDLALGSWSSASRFS